MIKVKKWVILTVHNFVQRGVFLTVFWTQAESLRLWWKMEDCSMREVQHAQRRGRRTMLLFSGWSDHRLQLIASGVSVPIVQLDCRVPSDSLVHTRGEIYMWADITWTSPVAERAASVGSLACGMWCGHIFWDHIQSWLLHSWQIEACP